MKLKKHLSLFFVCFWMYFCGSITTWLCGCWMNVSFLLSFPKSLFLVFWQMWTMARRFFFDRRTKTHNSLLFANPVAVPRLPDAIYLIRLFSHGFKNPRLFAFGLASFRRLFLITRFSKPSGRREMNSRWSFKPPGWNQTQHIMASERRGVK